VTQAGLDTLSNIRVPVAGLDEQKAIVYRIETAFAWIDRLASEARSARNLIKSASSRGRVGDY
jgi:type I restriction enzyme S subunit